MYLSLLRYRLLHCPALSADKSSLGTLGTDYIAR